MATAIAIKGFKTNELAIAAWVTERRLTDHGTAYATNSSAVVCPGTATGLHQSHRERLARSPGGARVGIVFDHRPKCPRSASWRGGGPTTGCWRRKLSPGSQPALCQLGDLQATHQAHDSDFTFSPFANIQRKKTAKTL